jgi:DNA-binding transcriptional ArsR family regulator
MTSPQSSMEDVLCSRARLRILKLLVKTELLTVSNIAAKIGVSYVSAKMHLEALEYEDILSCVMFGKRIRYYKFKESGRAKAVKELIQAWRVFEPQKDVVE